MRPRARRRRAAINPWSSTRRPKATRASRRRSTRPTPVWKSTSASGAPDNSSLSHFSAMTRPSWLGRAVNRYAIEQAPRRWRGGRHDDSARTRRKILISTQAYAYAPGGATVFVRRGRVDEALVIRGAYFGAAPLLICGELVAAAPRETFFTKQVVVKGRAACGTSRSARRARDGGPGTGGRVVACPGGVGVDALCGAIPQTLPRRALRGRRRRARGAGRAGNDGAPLCECRPRPAGVGRPGARRRKTVAACGAAVRGAVEFAGSKTTPRG